MKSGHASDDSENSSIDELIERIQQLSTSATDASSPSSHMNSSDIGHAFIPANVQRSSLQAKEFDSSSDNQSRFSMDGTCTVDSYSVNTTGTGSIKGDLTEFLDLEGSVKSDGPPLDSDAGAGAECWTGDQELDEILNIE